VLSLLLEQARELRAGRRLSGTLNARHHDDGGTGVREHERPMLPAERRGQLVTDDLHDLLRGREAPHDLLGERSRAHPGEEVIDDLEGDVGLEQRRAHALEGLIHLLGVELSPRLELLEDRVQTAGQRVEHAW
jgi:hypothetical protein